jgi:hypothetical protein
LVLSGLLAATLPASAEQATRVPQGPDEPATKFERFLLTKGVVQVREFYEIGTMQTPPGSVGKASFEVASAYSPGKRDSLLALRVTVAFPFQAIRTRIGVLDAEEVASLATALLQMKKMLEILKQGQPAQSTEVEFQGGSLRVGFFVTSGGEEKLFVKAGVISPETVFFDTGDFPTLDSLISQAAAKIQELRRK